MKIDGIAPILPMDIPDDPPEPFYGPRFLRMSYNKKRKVVGTEGDFMLFGRPYGRPWEFCLEMGNYVNSKEFCIIFARWTRWYH